MKLKEMAVQNVRSFGEKRTINLNNDFTILIGPNAGGKSNLLDIITVGLRKFFIRPWRLLRHEDASGQFFSFTSEDPFQNFFQELSKFEGATGHSVIEFEWEIDAQDIGNMEIVKNRLDVFRERRLGFAEGEKRLIYSRH